MRGKQSRGWRARADARQRCEGYSRYVGNGRGGGGPNPGGKHLRVRRERGCAEGTTGKEGNSKQTGEQARGYSKCGHGVTAGKGMGGDSRQGGELVRGYSRQGGGQQARRGTAGKGGDNRRAGGQQARGATADEGGGRQARGGTAGEEGVEGGHMGQLSCVAQQGPASPQEGNGMGGTGTAPNLARKERNRTERTRQTV